MPIQNIGSDIINAFLAGQRLKIQEESLNQEKQINEQKLQEDSRQFNERLKQISEQFKAQQAVRDSTFKLNKVKAQIQASQALSKGELAGVEGEGDILTAELPEIGLIQGVNPEAAARKKTDEAVRQRKLIEEAITPILAGRAGAVAEAQTPEIIKRRQAQTEGQLKVEELRAKNQKELEAERQTGRVSLANIRGRYTLQAAEKRRQTEIGIDPQGLELALRDLGVGASTLEDLPKSGLTAAERKFITQNARKRGIVPVNNATKEGLKNLGAATTVYRQVVELNDMIKANPGYSSNPFGQAKGLQSRIIGALGQLATAIGGQKGMLSQRDVDAMKGYVAKMTFGLVNQKVNEKAVEDFKRVLQSRQKIGTIGMSSEQKKLIFEQYDLIPDFQKAGPDYRDLTPEELKQLGLQ